MIRALAFGCLLLSACSTVGMADHAKLAAMDFGKPCTVNVCVYLDDGVSRSQAEYLLSSWDSEAPQYGLYIRPLLFEEHLRHGYLHSEIIADVKRIPLGEQCDRVLYFVGRTAGDYAYAMFGFPLVLAMPEVLGEVDDETMTHGFVVARRDSLNGLFFSPYDVTRHELYHLLGSCPHSWSLDDCYDSIKSHKDTAQGRDFFPSRSLDGRSYLTRAAVNQRLK